MQGRPVNRGPGLRGDSLPREGRALSSRAPRSCVLGWRLSQTAGRPGWSSSRMPGSATCGRPSPWGHRPAGERAGPRLSCCSRGSGHREPLGTGSGEWCPSSKAGSAGHQAHFSAGPAHGLSLPGIENVFPGAQHWVVVRPCPSGAADSLRAPAGPCRHQGPGPAVGLQARTPGVGAGPALGSYLSSEVGRWGHCAS